jgi:hypothetical protein
MKKRHKILLTMNQLIGLGITGLSVLLAAITRVCGCFAHRRWDRRTTNVGDISRRDCSRNHGPDRFLLRLKQEVRMLRLARQNSWTTRSFIVLGCLLYIFVAVTFFPPTIMQPLYTLSIHTSLFI